MAHHSRLHGGLFKDPASVYGCSDAQSKYLGGVLDECSRFHLTEVRKRLDVEMCDVASVVVRPKDRVLDVFLDSCEVGGLRVVGNPSKARVVAHIKVERSRIYSMSVKGVDINAGLFVIEGEIAPCLVIEDCIFDATTSRVGLIGFKKKYVRFMDDATKRALEERINQLGGE